MLLWIRYLLSFKIEALGTVLAQQSREHLRRVVLTWLKYYNHERNHQGIQEEIIKPNDVIGMSEGMIKYRSRLGKTLRYYYREAA